MNKHLTIRKIKIILKDNKLIFLLFLLWFLMGSLVYFFTSKLNFIDSVKAAFFLKYVDIDFSYAYNMWSQGIIFGIIFSIIFQHIIERNIPERSCRMMALEMKNHIVVIGYSHLGERIIGYLKKNKIPYSIIEKNEERVDEFLRAGEPVVVDDATETDALIDANVPLAKAVIITTDNIEASLIVTKKVREMNTKCFIITRCFRDELTEVIESLGANEVISSSKNAFEDIARKLNI